MTDLAHTDDHGAAYQLEWGPGGHDPDEPPIAWQCGNDDFETFLGNRFVNKAKVGAYCLAAVVVIAGVGIWFGGVEK
jgi:hypothetical protein